MGLGALLGGFSQSYTQGLDNKRRSLQIDRMTEENERADRLRAKIAAANGVSTEPQAEKSTGALNAIKNGVMGVLGQGDKGNGQQDGPGDKQVSDAHQGGSVSDLFGKAMRTMQAKASEGEDTSMDQIRLQMMSDQMDREGITNALEIAHQTGDAEATAAELNKSGQYVGWKPYGAAKRSEFDVAGQKVPGYTMQFVNDKGQIRTMNTAPDMFAKLSIDKQFGALADNQKFMAMLNHQNATLGEQTRHNQAMEGVSTLRASAAGSGGGKGKWVQDENGEWTFLNTSESTQGLPKETVKENDDGTFQVYDQGSGIARTVYTPAQAKDVARNRAMEESQQAGKGLFNREWSDEQVNKRAAEIEQQLLEGSLRQGRSNPAAGGIENNVGGMRPNGKSTGFQSFDTAEDGLKAVDDNLKSYGTKRGIDTLAGVINTWSPASDGNNTKKLIEDASRVTGLKPDQKIDLGNPAIRAVITAAIIRQEGSKAYRSGIGGSGGGKETQSAKSIDPVKKGVNFMNDPNNPLTGSVDVGKLVGKPMAAMGTMAGEAVASSIGALSAIKSSLTEAEYQKALAMAEADSLDIGPAIKQLGIDGFRAWLNSANPAKNTEQYMQRTSSNNLSQYFR